MRSSSLILVLALMFPASAIAEVENLIAPASGYTLPILIGKTWKSQDLRPGESIAAKVIQRVPVSRKNYLPSGTEIVGHVVAANPATISILFTQLRWKTKVVPIHVRLVAAASAFKVEQAKLPVGGTDRGTSTPADWTTRQIGGDQVYRSAGSGKVFNRYSQPVGYADFAGVYANPEAKGDLPRAMGPFSVNAKGLYGFPNLTLVSAGDNDMPIVLRATHSDGKVASGGALLLEVTR